MQTEGERISNIISHFCKSKAEFARRMDESPQSVSNWVARGAGKNVLNKILSRFPDVNANWLLTGEGEMLTNPNNCLDYKQSSVPYEFVEALMEERKRHDEMNAELIRQNGELIEIIKENKKTIVQPGAQKDAICATVSVSGSEK